MDETLVETSRQRQASLNENLIYSPKEDLRSPCGVDLVVRIVASQASCASSNPARRTNLSKEIL